MANLNSFLVAHDLQLELEQALARQAAVGGDLVTCLLEVSAISEDRMLALLSEAYGRPAAPAGELPAAEASARRLVPRATAQRHVMYPFELRSELLAAFVQEPLPAAVEDDLVFALGVQLEQRIALAARVHQALARAYGVPLPPRMKELLERLDSPRAQECATWGNAMRIPATEASPSARPDGASMGGAAARRSNGETRDSSGAGTGDATLVGVAPARRMVDGAPSGGAPRQNARGARACPSTLPPPRTAPDPSQAADITGLGAEREAYSMPASRTPTIPCGPPVQAFTLANSSAPPADFLMEATSATAADIEERRRRRASLPAGTSALRDWALRELGLSEPSGLSERRRGPLTHAQAEKALEAARTPDEALRVYFDFARQYFEYTAMFRLHGDLAEGQEAWGPGATGDRVRGIGVALDLPSILSQARDTRAPFVGVPSRDGIDAVLAEDLGRPMRLEVACVPVLVRGRALVVLYGDLGSEPVLPDDVGDVISFASLLGSTLEKMLLRRKRDVSRVPKDTDTLPPSSFPPASFPDTALSDPATTIIGAPPPAVGPRPGAASATPASPPAAAAPEPGRSTATAAPRPSTVATLRPAAPPAAVSTAAAIPASAVATTTASPSTLEPPRVPRVPSFDLDVDQRASTTDPAHVPPLMVPTPLAPLAAFDAEREGTMTPLVPEASLDSECRPLQSRPSPQAMFDAERSVSRPPPVVRKASENERVGNFPTPTRVAFEARRRNSPPPTAARADLDPLATPTGDNTPVVSPLAHLAALSATWTLDPAAVLGSSPPAAPISPSGEARSGAAPRPYSRPVAETLRVEPSYPRLTFADPSYADRAPAAPQLTPPVPDDPTHALAARDEAVRDGSAHHDPAHALGAHEGPARGEATRGEATQDGSVRDGSAHHDAARDRAAPDRGPAEPLPATPADPGVSAAAVAAGLRPMRIPHIAREEPESSPQPRPGAQGSTVPIARITHSPEASGGAVVVGARHPPASVGMAFASLPPVLIHADLVETVIAGGAAGERALGEILEIGEAAIPSVFSRFPGPLSVDRQYAATELPRPDECGPVLRILSALRRLALPFLAVRSADSTPEVRFWATYLLGDLHYQDAAIALWPRLFDEDLSVRTIALHAARTFVASKEAGAPIRVGLERIIASTEESEERRLHAIATIGALEWTPFVPALLRILDRSRSPVSIAAADALAALTGEDFGADPKSWNKWWKNHGHLFGEED